MPPEEAKQSESNAPLNAQKQVTPAKDKNELWREYLDAKLVQLQQSVDKNLGLVRAGAVFVTVGCLVGAVRYSSFNRRFYAVEQIPSSAFEGHQKLKGQLMTQSTSDPNVMYIRHTPSLNLFRKSNVQDESKDDWLKVRLFGVELDEIAREYVDRAHLKEATNVQLQLLRRVSDGNQVKESPADLALCHIFLSGSLSKKDLAQELLSSGVAECIPEQLHYYSDKQQKKLEAHLKQLERSQRRGQSMRNGIWEDFEEENFKQRLMSAGRRAASKSFSSLSKK